MRALDAQVWDERDEAADEVTRGERDAADEGRGCGGGLEVVVVEEEVGCLGGERERVEFGEEGGDEGGRVVGGPDFLEEEGGLGGVVADHGFGLRAHAVVF